MGFLPFATPSGSGTAASTFKAAAITACVATGGGWGTVWGIIIIAIKSSCRPVVAGTIISGTGENSF